MWPLLYTPWLADWALLFREWERLQLRTSHYKNHRIVFSLRCLHKDLVPVSIKLKSTLTTSKARQIIRKAEKDLLQVRVKAINNILDQVAKQTEECRARLASIISAERLRECQDFINKVSEIRFTKVRQRQLNKFNILVTKKEGNITKANAINLTQSNLVSQPARQASNNTPQANTQVGTLLPSREGRNQVQVNNLVSSQAPLNSTLATAHLPPGEGSSLLLAAAHLPSEGSSSSQAIQSTLANATPAIAHLSPEEGSSFPLATAHLPSEGNSSPQANSQASGSLLTLAIAHLPHREGSNSLPGDAHLPLGEGNSSAQATVLLPSGEGSNSSQAASLLPYSKGSSSPQASSSTQAGQVSNPTRSFRQSNRQSPRHRATQSSQESNTTSQEDNPTSTPQ